MKASSQTFTIMGRWRDEVGLSVQDLPDGSAGGQDARHGRNLQEALERRAVTQEGQVVGGGGEDDLPAAAGDPDGRRNDERLKGILAGGAGCLAQAG